MHPVRYATSQGVTIADQVVGDGGVDLIAALGIVTHLDVNWEEPSFARFLNGLASFSRLILFDKRGVGLSDRVEDGAALEERMGDIRAVMDAAGSARSVVFGVSEGACASALYAATFPERTKALILYGAGPLCPGPLEEPASAAPTVSEEDSRLQDEWYDHVRSTWGTRTVPPRYSRAVEGRRSGLHRLVDEMDPSRIKSGLVHRPLPSERAD